MRGQDSPEWSGGSRGQACGGDARLALPAQRAIVVVGPPQLTRAWIGRDRWISDIVDEHFDWFDPPTHCWAGDPQRRWRVTGDRRCNHRCDRSTSQPKHASRTSLGSGCINGSDQSTRPFDRSESTQLRNRFIARSGRIETTRTWVLLGRHEKLWSSSRFRPARQAQTQTGAH